MDTQNREIALNMQKKRTTFLQKSTFRYLVSAVMDFPSDRIRITGQDRRMGTFGKDCVYLSADTQGPQSVCPCLHLSVTL